MKLLIPLLKLVIAFIGKLVYPSEVPVTVMYFKLVNLVSKAVKKWYPDLI